MPYRIDCANGQRPLPPPSNAAILSMSPLSDEAIRTTLTNVFRDVFDDETLTVTSATTAADVDGWDSLAHVRLMLSVERAFGVRLLSIDDPATVQEWLRAPDLAVLETNVALVRPHCSLADLPQRIAGSFDAAGWSRW